MLEGETSNAVLFRIYNNFALATGIASAANVTITVYDGVGSNSQTCAVLPVSLSWIAVQMHGYGENSVTSPDRLTYYLGSNTMIGGNSPCGSNYYMPEFGSNGVASPATIRAYSNGNGMGFIEFSSTVAIPSSGITNTAYTFGVSCAFEWSS